MEELKVLWKQKGLILYGMFATWVSTAFIVILSNGIESQINFNIVIISLIVFILQLQKFLKIVKLSTSNDKMIENKDTILFTIASILVLTHIIIFKTIISLYIAIYATTVILTMINISNKKNISVFLFILSLVFLELIIMSPVDMNFSTIGNIIINFSILLMEILSILKIYKLLSESN